MKTLKFTYSLTVTAESDIACRMVGVGFHTRADMLLDEMRQTAPDMLAKAGVSGKRLKLEGIMLEGIE